MEDDNGVIFYSDRFPCILIISNTTQFSIHILHRFSKKVHAFYTICTKAMKKMLAILSLFSRFRLLDKCCSSPIFNHVSYILSMFFCSPRSQIEASFTARISNWRSDRPIWTVARVSFQMRPSMHRKARISNPTFKTFHKTQQERRNRPPLFYYPSPCPSEAAGALSSRSMASSMARLIKPFTLSLWASAWGLNKWPVLLLARVVVSLNSSKRYSVSCFSPMQSRT